MQNGRFVHVLATTLSLVLMLSCLQLNGSQEAAVDIVFKKAMYPIMTPNEKGKEVKLKLVEVLRADPTMLEQILKLGLQVGRKAGAPCSSIHCASCQQHGPFQLVRSPTVQSPTGQVQRGILVLSRYRARSLKITADWWLLTYAFVSLVVTCTGIRR
jgi:hypothetical protein